MNKIIKSDVQWKEQLTDNQCHICLQEGTEPLFSGKYNSEKEHGTLNCALLY